jgi:mycothiol synthase
MQQPQLLMRRPNLDDLPEIPPLPPGYVLREFQPDDLEPVAALMRAAFDDPQWTPEKFNAALIEAPDVKKTFVIAYEGTPVATASARLRPERFPDSGYVHWVAVDPAHQGKRLGYIVTLAVLHEFVRLGCKDAVLETDDTRLPAIKTYQNLGFQPEHTHESHPERWAEVIARLLAAIGL